MIGLKRQQTCPYLEKEVCQRSAALAVVLAIQLTPVEREELVFVKPTTVRTHHIADLVRQRV
jgi:hypothetical protein